MACMTYRDRKIERKNYIDILLPFDRDYVAYLIFNFLLSWSFQERHIHSGHNDQVNYVIYTPFILARLGSLNIATDVNKDDLWKLIACHGRRTRL